MAGDVRPSPRSRGALLEETRHVLDAQQELVHQQRNRATSSIRIVLTASGLALTVASLGLTTDRTNGGITHVASLGGPAAGIEHGFALAVVATIAVLTCRMLCAALVVLEPSTAAHPLARLLTTPVFGEPRPTRDHPSLPANEAPTLRAGLDADATTELSAAEHPYREILTYNAGCVAGNAALVRYNRWYLTRVYRSATVAIGLVTVVVIVAVAASAGVR